MVRRDVCQTTASKKTIAGRACFTRLWKLLSFPNTDVWQQHTSSTTGVKRLRNALELLASILWRLELAASLAELAEFPDQTMEDWRRQIIDERGLPLPWKLWSLERTGIVATVNENNLLIDFGFKGPPDSLLLRVLQNTLITDAVLRLAATREVLRAVGNYNSSLFFRNRRLQEELSNPSRSKIIRAVAIIVAMRDRYMHGEMSADKFWLSAFREKMHRELTDIEIFSACFTLWIELYKVCARAIRRGQAIA